MTNIQIALIVISYIGLVIFASKFVAVGSRNDNPFNEPEN
jgi:hypothetical protein